MSLDLSTKVSAILGDTDAISAGVVFNPPGDSRADSREALLPEFVVLRRRFDAWHRELEHVPSGFSAEIPGATPATQPAQNARLIATTIHRELDGFFSRRAVRIEPEDLRRLLRKGQDVTDGLITQFTAFSEVTLCSERLTAVLNQLLRGRDEPAVEFRELLDRVRDFSAAPNGRWLIWTDRFHELACRGLDCLPSGSRRSAPQVIEAGVLSIRIAARMCRSLSFSQTETDVILTACLFHDCGFLLLERHHGCGPDQLQREHREAFESHPHYGAALAGGLAECRAGAQRAIATHHHPHFTTGATGWPKNAGSAGEVTAIICRFVELLRECRRESKSVPRTDQTPITESWERLDSESRPKKWDRRFLDVLRSLLSSAEMGAAPATEITVECPESTPRHPAVHSSAVPRPHIAPEGTRGLQPADVSTSLGPGRPR